MCILIKYWINPQTHIYTFQLNWNKMILPNEFDLWIRIILIVRCDGELFIYVPLKVSRGLAAGRGEGCLLTADWFHILRLLNLLEMRICRERRFWQGLRSDDFITRHPVPTRTTNSSFAVSKSFAFGPQRQPISSWDACETNQRSGSFP